MMVSTPVFLDANALVYALDETSDLYDRVVAQIQQLIESGVTLCTSHHVIEEVLHIARKVSSITASEVVREINKIPGLVLIEPDAVIEFAERYAKLCDERHMGVNDALLLQLMVDAGITRLYSYDKKFASSASAIGIEQVA